MNFIHADHFRFRTAIKRTFDSFHWAQACSKSGLPSVASHILDVVGFIVLSHNHHPQGVCMSSPVPPTDSTNRAPKHAQKATPAAGSDVHPNIAARAVNLVKRYGSGDTAVTALDHVNIEFARGKFTAIMGPSGSGKSTLMHCMAGLDAVTAGGDGTLAPPSCRGCGIRTSPRCAEIAWVLCSSLLTWFPRLLPVRTSRYRWRSQAAKWIPTGCNEVTTRLGLNDRLSHRPAELSGGQQQRVAVARALISRPEIIFRR